MRSGGERDASAFVGLLIQHPEKGLSDIMSEFGLSREDIAELTKSNVVRDTLDEWLGKTMRLFDPSNQCNCVSPPPRATVISVVRNSCL